MTNVLKELTTRRRKTSLSILESEIIHLMRSLDICKECYLIR